MFKGIDRINLFQSSGRLIKIGWVQPNGPHARDVVLISRGLCQRQDQVIDAKHQRRLDIGRLNINRSTAKTKCGIHVADAVIDPGLALVEEYQQS